jgi:hypothetical protein
LPLPNIDGIFDIADYIPVATPEYIWARVLPWTAMADAPLCLHILANSTAFDAAFVPALRIFGYGTFTRPTTASIYPCGA